MIELAGWLGSACFAVCGVPLAIKTLRDGHARGLSWGFLLLWLAGEVLCTVYAFGIGATPLLFNYAFNLVCLIIPVWYKIQDLKA